MREIKFRGKNLYDFISIKEDGSYTEIAPGQIWLYGGYAEIEDCGFIFPEGKFHFGHGDYWADREMPDIPIVNKDTVGQYTGLKDGSGEDIYEGDIVRLYGVVGAPCCEVKFYSGGFVSERPNGKLCPLREELGIGSPAGIIGNIHDNPELLKSSSCAVCNK